MSACFTELTKNALFHHHTGDTVVTFLDLGYRMRFQPNIGGELMIHCHILNHEDKGMMTITNVTA